MKTLALLLLTTLTLTAQVVYDDGLFQAKSSTLLQGLQGYWRLEEASGTRYDRSRNSFHLTANNSPGNITGVSSVTGNAVALVSASSQSLTSATNACQLNGNSFWTVVCWAKLTTTNAFQFPVARDNGATKREWGIYWDTTFTRWNAFIGNGASSIDIVFSDASTDPANTWMMLTLVRSNSVLYFSRNNGPFSPKTITVIPGNSDNPLSIGNVSTLYLNGSVDEVGIWNRQLSTNELTQLYRSGSGVTHPQFHARAFRDWRRFEPKFPTLAAWLNRKQEVIDL